MYKEKLDFVGRAPWALLLFIFTLFAVALVLRSQPSTRILDVVREEAQP